MTVALLIAGPAAQAAPQVTIPTAGTAPTVVRLAGVDRYATSVAVSQRYSPGVDAVFVATGADYPDALSAAAAAAAAGGPLLLTRTGTLPANVRAEIKRLRPARIVVVGGTGVVAPAVVTALTTMAPTQRLSGDSRYSTAERLIDKTFGTADRVFLATGRGFADALGATSAAGSTRAPLLLVDGAKSTLPASTMAALKRWGVKNLAIAGGHGAVDIRIEQQLRTAGYAVSRHSGSTRYETATALHDAYFADAVPPADFLATGVDFPDALSGAALAGFMRAPLLLTRAECVPWAPSDALARSTAPQRIVVGGTAVVSAAAADNTACEGPPPAQAAFATTGWKLDKSVAQPYTDGRPVDVHDPRIVVDSTGLRVYTRSDNGQRADHPVAYAQYGIAALQEFQRTGDPLWMKRAVRHAQRLEQIHTERDGAWWFPYMFPWTYYQRTMNVPWWSGMAQGQVLSLFVRLYEQTGDARWKTDADRTWESFLQPRSQAEPWATVVDGGRLFFEEYAGNQPPLLVLNGQIFAIYGVYDYWVLTGDPMAAKYVDGGATTVLKIMPLIRKPGGVSYYCAQQPYCKSPLWQNQTYHRIHSGQLDTLARLTGDSAFRNWADLLRKDWQPAAARMAAPEELQIPLGWDGGPPQ